DFKDPAVDAVDRFSDRETLEQIATRAKNRNVAKRARTLVREMDDRAAQEAAAAAEAAGPTDRVRQGSGGQESGPDVPSDSTWSPAVAGPAAAPTSPEPAPAEDEERRTAEEAAAAQRRAEQEAAARAQREAEEGVARMEAERRHARLSELVTAAEAAA